LCIVEQSERKRLSQTQRARKLAKVEAGKSGTQQIPKALKSSKPANQSLITKKSQQCRKADAAVADSAKAGIDRTRQDSQPARQKSQQSRRR